MNNEPSTLETTTNLGELTRIRKHLRGVCDDCNRTRGKEREIGELELAVIEAVTNVIRHSCRNVSDQPISHEVTIDGAKVTYAIRHHGEAFSPLGIEIPDEMEPMEGGMGLFIMEQFLDDIEYSQVNENTQCILLTKCF